MILKKIKLHNFRQFYDTCKLELSTDKEKNITLVHGENGVGKTTLLNSILWCFFGRTTDDFENPNDFISNQAVKEGDKSCYVEINIIHKDNEYRIRRQFTTGVKPSDKDLSVFPVKNGVNHEEIDNPKSLINEALPNDMADYFFFHGEGASKLSSTSKRGGFREAIRDILGFTIAEKAIEDLEYHAKRKESEISSITNISKETEQALKKKQSIDDHKKILKEESIKIKTNIQSMRFQKEELQEKLKNSDHELVREKNSKLSSLKSNLGSRKRERTELDKRKKSLVQRYGANIFCSTFSEEAAELLDERGVEGKIPGPYEEVYINFLLEKEICICERPLKEGSFEYINVQGKKKNANTDVINQKLLKARTYSEGVKIQNKRFLEDVKEVENSISMLEKNIGIVEVSITEVSRELENYEDDSKVREWQKEIVVLENSIGREFTKLGEAEAGIKNCNLHSSSLEKRIFKGDGKNLELKILQKYIEMINKLISRCKHRLIEYEESSKSVIVNKVNHILNEFSRKDYKVKLTDNYEFYLVREDGKRVAKSKGESLLLNLSFVSALIKHASERESESGRFLISGATAPFVIDAPFGELDETYKGATARFLPENSNQLVLFLSSSHWKGTVDESIKGRVGKEYLLISHRTGEKGNKPEDEITINKKIFKQSLYSQGKEKTQIQEVNY